ncbi:MAG: Na+/H+ antiporter NhaA [Campylobacteraceae bacterium]|nr:Na+/H+ antiporter NhaA [Campylobacteraceae bacterium]
MKILVRDFIKKESSSGLILVFVTLLAIIIKNSPLSSLYNDILYIIVEFQFGEFIHIKKPFMLWINDGLMTIFFLLIGLEIKRELILGHLSTMSRLALPGFAALGGMIFPALIFVFFNMGDDFALRGWAIPIATDIAFALGVLSLLGKSIPVALKIFLMALAIIDDIGAILIIAIFYTSEISLIALFFMLVFTFILLLMNKLNVTKITAYLLVGVFLWVAVLESGIHATLAGIVLAFTIPLNVKNDHSKHTSPAKILQKNLHFWVAYFILPMFAFVNAGIDLSGLSIESLSQPVSLGIMSGLFFGKQMGVMLFTYMAVYFKFAILPRCTTWCQIYGVSLLCGIGFTMSFFINTLAYGNTDLFMYSDRMSILIGSLISGILGYWMLKRAKKKKYCSV